MSTFDIERLLGQMAADLRRLLAAEGRERPLMVGIRTGGVWVAERLHERLGIEAPLGELSINFYRDDFTRIGLHPRVEPSSLPFDVDDRHILLTLAVLADRGGHELPVRADVTGATVRLGPGEHLKLTGPEPLALEILGPR